MIFYSPIADDCMTVYGSNEKESIGKTALDAFQRAKDIYF